MSKQARAGHPIYNLLPTEIEGFDSLAELALDMRWSWNHATDEVWRKLDANLWETTHNPWVALQTVSRDRIDRVLGDPVFRNSTSSGCVSPGERGGEWGRPVPSPRWPEDEVRHALDGKWDSLRFGDLRVETNADRQAFEVEIFLGDLDSNAARVIPQRSGVAVPLESARIL